MSESLEQKKARAQKILARLKKGYPSAKIVLKYGNNIQLLTAVILSAQCTDKKVNEVTEKLSKKYKTVDDFASANLKIFEQEIRPCGFYHNKAKNIIAAAKMIRDKFGGKLPKTMEEMIELPGVARKTANIALGNAYGVVEGIAVDTHVRRVSRHLGLT
ncbi:MAG: endonuclease III, partial [Candidatus Spechtbacterales bacterium]